jgi:hypothetical protein
MKKKIIWLIQSNQITPIIKDYLKTLQTRIEQYIELLFFVPETSSDILEKIKCLNPIVFKIKTRTANQSYQAYLSKREFLYKKEFTEGLSFADTLLADDLSGGNARQTILEISLPDNTCGIILQVPTPLGSSEMEERIFQSAILWAKQNTIPVLGYELLPLDTKWTLAPSLPDGIITRHHESFAHLKKQLDHRNIWLLPIYEASIFSSVSTSFNLNGAKACYHYRNEHSIPADRTVLYLPHNVAMIYEYHELIKILQPLGDKLHLMLSIGKDQVRGPYSQKEMIEIIYTKELKNFASYSFHDTNIPWEMMMADAIVACSACFNTQIAEKEIPCIIFDPQLPSMTRGNKKRVSTQKNLLKCIHETMASHQDKRELADILMLLTKTGSNND